MKKSVFLIIVLLVTAKAYGNTATVYDPNTKEGPQKSQVTPSKFITPFSSPELIGADFSLSWATPQKQEGDSRFGVKLKAFSLQGWFYHEAAATYMDTYLEVVSPVEPRKKYKDLVFLYQGGLQANLKGFLIPYMAIGPGVILRQEKQVTCRNNEYCFGTTGSYKEEKESYYTRLIWGAKAGMKFRLKGFEIDISSSYMELPNNTVTGVQFGAGISM